MKRVRILLADDHEVVRRGIRAIIETQPGWEVCGEATDGQVAVRKAKQLKPDLVILDIGMPRMNGLEATRQILKVVPKTEVLVLTIHNSEQLIQDVLKAGARGYLLKSDAGRDLASAVKTLLQHKPYMTSIVSDMVLEGFLSSDIIASHVNTRLTPREREIVQLLAEGQSNKEVASTLTISPKTVETHRANIMLKLNLHSIGALVRYAIRNKIAQP